MDALKETLDAWLARIKSPVLGYIVLAFVLVNWKPLWFLVFSDENGYAKINYFERHTDYLSLYFWPFVYGLGAAIAAPWVELLGALIARRPTRIRLARQDDHDTDVKEAALKNAKRLVVAQLESDADIEKAKEEAAIARAERDKKAKEVGEGAVEAIEQSRKKSPFDERPLLPEEVKALVERLSDVEAFILREIGAQSEALNLVDNGSVNMNYRKMFVRRIMDENQYDTFQRAEMETAAALSRIRKLELAVESQSIWRLTGNGFKVYDLIK